MPTPIASLTREINTGSGTKLYISKTLASTAVTTTGTDLTGTSTGTLYIEDVIINVGVTAATSASATNCIVSSDNTYGGPNLTTAVTGLTASASIGMAQGSVTKVPGVLEAGKKLTIKATGAALGGTGNIRVDIVAVRLTDGATVSAA